MIMKTLQARIQELENRIAAPKGDWFRKLSPAEQTKYLHEHNPKFGETKPELSHEDMQLLSPADHKKFYDIHNSHSTTLANTPTKVPKVQKHNDAAAMHYNYMMAHRETPMPPPKKSVYPPPSKEQHLEIAKNLHNKLSSSPAKI